MTDHHHGPVPAQPAIIKAQPAPITIDLARTVLIVVDMQNDFASKGGMFDRAGIDISMIRSVLAPTVRAISAARKAGIQVVYGISPRSFGSWSFGLSK